MVTNLEVDCKCRDLLRKAQKVNGRVEQVGLKLRLEINWTTTEKGKYEYCTWCMIDRGLKLTPQVN